MLHVRAVYFVAATYSSTISTLLWVAGSFGMCYVYTLISHQHDPGFLRSLTVILCVMLFLSFLVLLACPRSSSFRLYFFLNSVTCASCTASDYKFHKIFNFFSPDLPMSMFDCRSTFFHCVCVFRVSLEKPSYYICHRPHRFLDLRLMLYAVALHVCSQIRLTGCQTETK